MENNFMNLPENVDSIETLVLADYKRGIMLKTLAKLYDTTVSELRAMLQEIKNNQ